MLPIPPRAHALLYRLTRGALGSHLPFTNLHVLLLTTKGRRSRKLRTTPVIYFRQEDCLVVVASNRGAARYPQWYWNLQFSPEATVQIGRSKHQVIAKEARPEERRPLWPLLTRMLPLFELYQERTARELAVVMLHPVSRPQ